MDKSESASVIALWRSKSRKIVEMMEKGPDFIIYILAILYVLCDGPSSYAQEDASYCSTYTFEMIAGDSVRLIREDDSSTFTGQISKKVDLNLDGLDDFIINFGICGNWGDCVYGIYVQQTDQTYRCVFQPEYWYSGKWDLLEKECTRVNGVQWMKLRLYSRTDYGGDPPGIVPTYLLQFDGSSYQTIELQSLTNWPNNANETETFGVQKEYTYRGKTYQVGRILLKDFKYGPLTLRVIKKDTITDILAPMDEYPDLQMSHADLIKLHGRPFFLVIDRYRVYLVDLENEKISSCIQPGLGVEYGDDSISGTLSSLQFFDEDQYLLGIAVSYGVFCFNISDLDDPKELLRYTSGFSDRGQPYFFLEENADGTYNGIVSGSDTLKKSNNISSFYTATDKATYLFQDAQIMPLDEPYIDPSIDEAPKPFVLLYEKGTNGKRIPWVVDLDKGRLIQGRSAQRFIDRQP